MTEEAYKIMENIHGKNLWNWFSHYQYMRFKRAKDIFRTSPHHIILYPCRGSHNIKIGIKISKIKVTWGNQIGSFNTKKKVEVTGSKIPQFTQSKVVTVVFHPFSKY